MYRQLWWAQPHPCRPSTPSIRCIFRTSYVHLEIHSTQWESGSNSLNARVWETDWDTDREKLVALLIVTWWWSCQTSSPRPWSVHPVEFSQFAGLSWWNHATLWLFPWGFIHCHGTALANKCEFSLISSWLVMMKILSKDIINMQRVSLIISWDTVEYRSPFFCA